MSASFDLMIRPKIKQAARKAIIQVGRDLRELQLSKEVHAMTLGNSSVNLARRSADQIRHILGVKLRGEVIKEDEEKTIIDIGGCELLLVHLNGLEAFMHGLPEYCLALSCVENDECFFSGVFNPYFKEFYFGEKDKGVRRNNLVCGVNEISELTKSIIGFTLPSNIIDAESAMRIIASIARKAAKTTIPGSELYGLSQVAKGTLSGMVIFSKESELLNPGLELVKFAGGCVSSMTGSAMPGGDEVFIASNRNIHQALRDCVFSCTQDV